MMRAVEENGDEIVVQDHGRPRVAIISMSDYEGLQVWRDQQRRQQALAELRALRERVRAREANATLTVEQAEALADRFVREVVQEMFDEGKLRYADEG